MMTRLSKDFVVSITPGVAGVPGSPGVSARAAYWYDRSPVPAVKLVTPAPIYAYSPPAPPLGQYIRRAAQQETRHITSIRPFYDNYAANIIYKDALKAEWYRALTVLHDRGSLGTPLAFLPSPYPSGTYIAAWNAEDGTWYSVFYGFTDRPTQTIVT